MKKTGKTLWKRGLAGALAAAATLSMCACSGSTEQTQTAAEQGSSAQGETPQA